MNAGPNRAVDIVTNAFGDTKEPLLTAVSVDRVSQVIVEQIRGLLREGKLGPETGCRVSASSASSSV